MSDFKRMFPAAVVFVAWGLVTLGIDELVGYEVCGIAGFLMHKGFYFLLGVVGLFTAIHAEAPRRDIEFPLNVALTLGSLCAACAWVNEVTGFRVSGSGFSWFAALAANVAHGMMTFIAWLHTEPRRRPKDEDEALDALDFES